MYDYEFQPPNLNYSRYYGKILNINRIPEVPSHVELGPLNRWSPAYIPGAYAPPAISAMWLSLILNSNVSRTRGVKTPDLTTLWTTEMNLQEFLGGPFQYWWRMVEIIREKLPILNITLHQLHGWKEVRVAIAEGLTVMVGGTVYDSFQQAAKGRVVPMPKHGEGLLGGHVFNLISFDPDKDMGRVIGNLGKDFGVGGLLDMTGSYLRNLSINKDFFLVTVDEAHGSN